MWNSKGGMTGMKAYYFSRKQLLAMGTIGVVVTICLAIAYYGQHEATITTGGEEPIFQGNTGSKSVAITVNVDWGEEFLPAMLEEFQSHNAQVTFFVTGQWADKNPAMLKQMVAAGHSIQNHGYRHCHFKSLGQNEVAAEIKKAEATISKITGQPTAFFAPPYGEFNSQLVQTVNGLNYKYIMWSVDTIDWERPSPETIINRVMKKVHNDAIILMHPTEPTIKALPVLLEQLGQQNYQMVTIDIITGGKAEVSNEAS